MWPSSRCFPPGRPSQHPRRLIAGQNGGGGGGGASGDGIGNDNGRRGSGRRKRRRKWNRNCCLFPAALLGVIYVVGLLHVHLEWTQNKMETQDAASLRIWESFLDLLDHSLSDLDPFPPDDDHSAKDAYGYGLDRDATFWESAASRIRGVFANDPSRPSYKFHVPVNVLFEAPSELLLPKPIIAVGFPKAGTSSIFSFFRCNGLSAQHWYCCDEQNHPSHTERKILMSKCMIENMILSNSSSSSTEASPPMLFEGCGDYDVYTEINGPRNFAKYNGRTLLEDGTLLPLDQSFNHLARIWFPQHFRLQEIHKQFPNATFLLNQRPVDDWVKSVLSWNNNLEFQILNEFYAQSETKHIFPDELLQRHFVPAPLPAEYDNVTRTNTSASTTQFNVLNVKEALRIVYEHHIQYVKDFVKRHPSHTLLDIDITQDDAGKKLASVFGLHEACWGHFNQNTKDQQGGIRWGGSGRGGMRGGPPGLFRSYGQTISSSSNINHHGVRGQVKEGTLSKVGGVPSRKDLQSRLQIQGRTEEQELKQSQRNGLASLLGLFSSGGGSSSDTKSNDNKLVHPGNEILKTTQQPKPKGSLMKTEENRLALYKERRKQLLSKKRKEISIAHVPVNIREQLAASRVSSG